MKTYRLPLNVGIFAGILSGIALTGCGAGTGQTLNSPNLSSRNDGASSASGATRAVVNSVLPAKRVGLFIADYDAKADRIPGAADKPGNFAPAKPTFEARNYAHVFVSVYKIELVSADEQAFPVWADDAGRVVDLASLGEKNQVAVLGAVAVPGVTGKKTYKRARITLGKSITFFKKGDTTAKPMPMDDAVGRDDEGRPVITMVLNRPRDLGNGKEDLVIAFDREAFTATDNRVTPVLREGNGGKNVDAENQSASDVTGVVSESSAGGDGADRVFVITPDGGARGETQVIWMKSSTPFFRADGKPSPTLVDGARVAVRGTLQNNTKRLVAQSVAILDADSKPGDAATLRGAATAANPDTGTLTLALTGLRGIEPAYAESTVLLGENAVLRGASGLVQTKDAFFAGLKGATIEAEGDYEPTTGVLTATRLRRVSPAADAKREATVLATAKSVDGSTLTLVAPLLEWDGIAPPAAGKSWTVNTASAVCRDKAGKAITLTELLAAAKNPDDNAVRVVGTYAGGAITASRLELAAVPAPAVTAAKTVKVKSDKTDAEPDAKPAAAKRKIAPPPDPEASPDAPAVI